MSTTKHEWKEKTSPARLERRFEFADYDATRAFLDMAAELSKATDVYPDVSFGRTYVNMTLYLNQDAGADAEAAAEYVRRLDSLTDPAA